MPVGARWWQGILVLPVTATLGVALVGCEGNRASDSSESVFDLLPAPPTPAVAAAWMFDPYDPDKRFRGTLLLANAPFGGAPEYVKGYVMHLSDSDSSVRAAAALALGRHGSPEHVPLILPLLTQEDRLCRLSAVRALQRLHNPVAVGPLIDATDSRKESDADVRAEAAVALAQYPQPRVLQALIAALGDDRLAVTAAAAQSLRTLTGQDFGDDRARWFDWAAAASEPFAGQRPYTYPVFARDKSWLEHIPFWPPPPNEEPARPVGLPPPAEPVGGAGAQARSGA
jgi:hypothetical protein